MFDVLRRGTPGTPGETDCKANVDLRRRPLMTASRRRLGDDDGDQIGDDDGKTTMASSLKTTTMTIADDGVEMRTATSSETTTARPLLLPWIITVIAIDIAMIAIAILGVIDVNELT
jgi:hypothetical protein